MVKIFLKYIVLLGGFLISSQALAEIYKCKSKDGIINFTSVPCGQKSSGIKRPEKKKIELNEDGTKKTKKQIIAERLKNEKEYLEAIKRQRIDEKNKKAKLDKHNNKVKQNCAKAKKASADYERAQYIYTKDESGKKTILSDAERVKAQKDTQRQITYWCGR